MASIASTSILVSFRLTDNCIGTDSGIAGNVGIMGACLGGGGGGTTSVNSRELWYPGLS